MSKSSLRVAATIAGIAAGVLLVGPQMLGGPVAAVSTFGDSMLPTYRPHEMVVVRRDGQYAPGEIIAYRSPRLEATVLHRIVGSDEQGLITRGDNNDWTDQDRPTADHIIGQAWFSVPHAGRLLELPAGIRIVLPLAALAGTWFTPHRQRQKPSPERRGQRRRRQGEQQTPGERDRARWSGTPVQLAAAGAVALLIGGIVAGLSWTRPASQPGPVDHEHEGRFSYHADVPVSHVYPDGRIDPGETVFLRLADRLDVSFDWTFVTQRSADLHGTGQLTATVKDGSGWSRTMPVGPDTDWTGKQATLTGQLDLARIQELAEQVAQTTGVTGSNRTVELTADLAVRGTVDGAPVESDIEPTVTFRVDDLRAMLATSGDPGSDPLQVTEAAQLTLPEAHTAHLTLLGRSVPVAVARPASLMAIMLGIVTVISGAVLARTRRGWDEHRRILDRYGDRIVHVAALPPAGARSRIPLPNIDHLIEVAEHRDLPVLRVPMRTGGHGYVVDDITSRFRYIPGEGTTPAPTNDPAPSNGDNHPGTPRPGHDRVNIETGTRATNGEPPARAEAAACP